MRSNAALLSDMLEVISNSEALLRKIDDLREHFPELDLASIYIDQALTILHEKLGMIDTTQH